MGLRFRKTFSIFPGLKLNVGKRSASVRLGVKGIGFTAGTAGKTFSASLPGTGLGVVHKFKSSPGTDPVGAKHRRRWLLLLTVYLIAGLLWWQIIKPL
jgi:hypothetical protein